ncbi:hypothetical protein L218DRAFT_998647 [Marasmius fiardii PR-910]|nr:hypothetical protein L218DRAFT_998647 [Marasmius fiardii PR-910]
MNASDDFSGFPVLGELQYPDFTALGELQYPYFSGELQYPDFPGELQYPDFSHSESVSGDTGLSQNIEQEPSNVDLNYEQMFAQVRVELFGDDGDGDDISSPDYVLSPPSDSRSPNFSSPTIQVPPVNESSSLALPGTHESIELFASSSFSCTRDHVQPPANSTHHSATSNHHSTLLLDPLNTFAKLTIDDHFRAPSLPWASTTAFAADNRDLIFGTFSTPHDERWSMATATALQNPNIEQAFPFFGNPMLQYPPMQTVSSFPDPTQQIQLPAVQNSPRVWFSDHTTSHQYSLLNDGIISPSDVIPPNEHGPGHYSGPIFGWEGPEEVPPGSIPGLIQWPWVPVVPGSSMSQTRGTKRKSESPLSSPQADDVSNLPCSPPSSSSSLGGISLPDKEKKGVCHWLVPDYASGTWAVCGENVTEDMINEHLRDHLDSIGHEPDMIDGSGFEQPSGLEDSHGHDGSHLQIDPKIRCRWEGCQNDYKYLEVFRHVRTHLRWLETQCRGCGTTFARRDTWRRHSISQSCGKRRGFASRDLRGRYSRS